MEKALLFKRKFNGETYEFYMNKGVGCFGIYSEYVSVETPKNDFGYNDTVLFSQGKGHTMNRYLQNWILKAITDILIKKGERRESYDYQWFYLCGVFDFFCR